MTSFQDIFTCSVCLDIYQCPKRMPLCQHIFCKSCLNGLAGNTGYITCPECRGYQQLPAGQVEGLKDDLKLNNVMVYFLCLDCNTIHPLTSPCIRCKSNACPDCKSKHTTDSICEVISTVRKLRAKEPSEDQAAQLEEMKIKWQEFINRNADLKKQVNKSYQIVHKALNDMKRNILTALTRHNQIAEGRMSLIDQIVALPKFVDNIKDTYDRLSFEEADKVLTECKVFHESVSIMNKLLVEGPEVFHDINTTNVLSAIREMGGQITKVLNGEVVLGQLNGENDSQDFE